MYYNYCYFDEDSHTCHIFLPLLFILVVSIFDDNSMVNNPGFYHLDFLAYTHDLGLHFFDRESCSANKRQVRDFGMFHYDEDSNH